MNIITDKNNETLSRIKAMRYQESTLVVYNYFNRSPLPSSSSQDMIMTDVEDEDIMDESSRKAMVIWLVRLQKTLGLSSETVSIGISYLDRYLSSGRGNSYYVLHNRCHFQLAAITCFYTGKFVINVVVWWLKILHIKPLLPFDTPPFSYLDKAVKIYEPVVLGLDMLVQICRDTYTEEDIMAMERDILQSLHWRVSVHTAMEYIRTVLDLVDVHAYVVDSLLSSCQTHMDAVITNLTFSCCKPSVVGVSILATSLAECKLLSIAQKQGIWSKLSSACHFDAMMSSQVIATQQFLSQGSASPSPCSSPKSSVMEVSSSPYKSSSIRSTAVTISPCSSVSTSPIQVTATARQA